MKPATILLADDDSALLTVLVRALEGAGHIVKATKEAKTLTQWVEAGLGDLVITDVIMPDGNGLELIQKLRAMRGSLPIVVMSARNSLLTALRATERGAFDYLAKPFDLNFLLSVVERALAEGGRESLEVVPEVLGDADAAGDDELPMLGRSPAMQKFYRLLARVVQSDLTVLLTGESGTGKELAARTIHQMGGRRKGAFVAVNMAAIPRELIETELFGYEKGAFTGAERQTPGRFEDADKGTLFLDEIGDMPLEAQTRLLRVLQDGCFTRVGGRKSLRCNVRIISATHRDLETLVANGQFRSDLYYRLNVIPLRLPPLRDRKEDILPLALHFLRQASGGAERQFDQGAAAALQAWPWPGNVRELENFQRRIAVLYNDRRITEKIVLTELAQARPHPNQPLTADESADSRKGKQDDFPGADSLAAAVGRHLEAYFAAHEGKLPASGLYDRVLREVEIPLIAQALAVTSGNQLRAADLLGLNRNTLHKKAQALGLLKPARGRPGPVKK